MTITNTTYNTIKIPIMERVKMNTKAIYSETATALEKA